MGVKCLTVETNGRFGRTVEWVTHDGVPHEQAVDTDLMGSSRLQTELHQGKVAEPLDNTPVRTRGSAPFDNCHFLAVNRMPTYGCVHDALRCTRSTIDDRQVISPRRLVLDLLLEMVMGMICLCHHQQAARILVEAMHYSRPLDTIDAGETFPTMGKQRVDKGVVAVAGGRVNYQTLGFVDDEQFLVFVDNFEGQRLGTEFENLIGRNHDLDAVACPQAVTGFAAQPVHPDLTLRNKLLNPGTRQRRLLG